MHLLFFPLSGDPNLYASLRAARKGKVYQRKKTVLKKEPKKITALKKVLKKGDALFKLLIK